MSLWPLKAFVAESLFQFGCVSQFFLHGFGWIFSAVWRRSCQSGRRLPNWCQRERDTSLWESIHTIQIQPSAHNYTEQSQLCVIVMCGTLRWRTWSERLQHRLSFSDSPTVYHCCQLQMRSHTRLLLKYRELLATEMSENGKHISRQSAALFQSFGVCFRLLKHEGCEMKRRRERDHGLSEEVHPALLMIRCIWTVLSFRYGQEWTLNVARPKQWIIKI